MDRRLLEMRSCKRKREFPFRFLKLISPSDSILIDRYIRAVRSFLMLVVTRKSSLDFDRKSIMVSCIMDMLNRDLVLLLNNCDKMYDRIRLLLDRGNIDCIIYNRNRIFLSGSNLFLIDALEITKTELS